MGGVLDPLEKARRALEMSVTDLRWRYFSVGGMGSELEIERPGPVTELVRERLPGDRGLPLGA